MRPHLLVVLLLAGISGGLCAEEPATAPEPTSPLIVVDALGKPVRRATLYIVDASGAVRKRIYSAVDGTAALPLPEKTAESVIAVGSEDAIAIVAAKAIRGAKETPFRLAIPAPTETLELHASLDGGAPAEGVSFAVRLDGVPLPQEVMSRLEQHQSRPFETNRGGVALLGGLPEGRYQVTVRAKQGSPLQMAPIDIPAHGGLEVVDVVLK